MSRFRPARRPWPGRWCRRRLERASLGSRAAGDPRRRRHASCHVRQEQLLRPDRPDVGRQRCVGPLSRSSPAWHQHNRQWPFFNRTRRWQEPLTDLVASATGEVVTGQADALGIQPHARQEAGRARRVTTNGRTRAAQMTRCDGSPWITRLAGGALASEFVSMDPGRHGVRRARPRRKGEMIDSGTCPIGSRPAITTRTR